MNPDRPPDLDDDAVSVTLAERIAADRAEKEAQRARLPAFFFGMMFAFAAGGLLLSSGGGGDEAEPRSGFDVGAAALVLFAALAAALGLFGEKRVRRWLGQDRTGPR
ncbi:MAG: hypothetical protein FJX42_06605 [Alphaproteobacteria bacterium]|nr:hypothetical protein [Alphaproteobacteria bacterium]